MTPYKKKKRIGNNLLYTVHIFPYYYSFCYHVLFHHYTINEYHLTKIKKDPLQFDARDRNQQTQAYFRMPLGPVYTSVTLGLDGSIVMMRSALSATSAGVSKI